MLKNKEIQTKETQSRISNILPSAEALELTINGETKKYFLQPPDLNTLSEMEDHFDCSLTKIDVLLNAEEKGMFKNIRFMIFSILRQDNSEITEDQVGKAITTANLEAVSSALSRAFAKANPLPGE